MNIAIIYDWVNRRRGGAERVLTALHEIWPEAPLYTSVYNPKQAKWAQIFPEVKTSFVNCLPWAKKRAYWYYPLITVGFEQFEFDEYDLVISVTTGPAKAVITKPETRHICYCLTPPIRHIYNRKNFIFNYFKKQDYVFGQRPDKYIATCENVALRIEEYYDRQAEIIYPGVDLEKFKLPAANKKLQDYFLLVSRLVDHKKVDLAVKVFNYLGWQLKVVGTGRSEFKFKQMAEDNIQFLGEVDDQKLVKLYQQCRGVIFPQEEDFGLVPIEAMACGRPVAAYKAGGALETIISGKTGEFFFPQTPKALIKTLIDFKKQTYPPETCRRQAEKFSHQNFKKQFKSFASRFKPKLP